MSRPYTLAVGGKETKHLFAERDARGEQRKVQAKAMRDRIRAELRAQLLEPLISGRICR